MSDRLYRTQLRFPPALAEKLKGIAEENGQSFNKEVIDRLEESLAEPRDPLEPITADEAKRLAEQGVKNSRNKIIRDCMSAIIKQASTGSQELWLEVGYQDAEAAVYKKVIPPVIEHLESLGYKVYYDDGFLVIKF